MAPRTTTTSSRAHTTLKHPLQRRRDTYGFKISKNWLPQADRLHRNPHPIHATSARNTYQSVVHQSLIHVPIFLRWIQSHTAPYIDGHDPNDCIMCQYKRLAATYWGAKSTGSRIEVTNPNVARIREMTSATSRSKGDAAEFYKWVTAHMKYANAPAHGTSAYYSWAMKNWREALWNEEYRAMFQLDYDEEDTCRECGTVVISSAAATTMNVMFDLATMHDLEGILTQSFFTHVRQAPCETCAALTMHDRRRQITAAPQILRICVDINTPSGNIADRILRRTTKQLHSWHVPDQLNLGPRQANASLPLEYTLSSAIAHGGSGGRMEVGGQVVLPAAREDEEEKQEQTLEESGDSDDDEQDDSGIDEQDDSQDEELDDADDEEHADSDDKADSMDDVATPSPRENKEDHKMGTNKLFPWDEWESSENESVQEDSNDDIPGRQEVEDDDTEDDESEDEQNEHNDSDGSSSSDSDFDPLAPSKPQPTERASQSPTELQQEYEQDLLEDVYSGWTSGAKGTDQESYEPSEIDVADENFESHSGSEDEVTDQETDEPSNIDMVDEDENSPSESGDEVTNQEPSDIDIVDENVKFHSESEDEVTNQEPSDINMADEHDKPHSESGDEGTDQETDGSSDIDMVGEDDDSHIEAGDEVTNQEPSDINMADERDDSHSEDEDEVTNQQTDESSDIGIVDENDKSHSESEDEVKNQDTNDSSDIDMADENNESHPEPGDEDETGTNENVNSRDLGSRILNDLLNAGFKERSNEQSQAQEQTKSDSHTMSAGQSEEEREIASSPRRLQTPTRPRRLHTPSRPRKYRGNTVRSLHSLRKVENADFLAEIGPSLDAPDAPSLRKYVGEKFEEDDVALFRRSSLVTPSRTGKHSRISKPVSKRASSSPLSRYLNNALSFAGLKSQGSHCSQGDSSNRPNVFGRVPDAGNQPTNTGNHPTSVDLTAFDPTIANNGWRKESNSSKHEVTWTTNVGRPLPDQHHIINVRGPDNTSHIGNDHQEQLGPGELHENPQRPEHDCYRPTGYQVIVLTYTRNPLKGAWGKMEWMVPEF